MQAISYRVDPNAPFALPFHCIWRPQDIFSLELICPYIVVTSWHWKYKYFYGFYNLLLPHGQSLDFIGIWKNVIIMWSLGKTTCFLVRDEHYRNVLGKFLPTHPQRPCFFTLNTHPQGNKMIISPHIGMHRVQQFGTKPLEITGEGIKQRTSLHESYANNNERHRIQRTWKSHVVTGSKADGFICSKINASANISHRWLLTSTCLG